MQKATNLKKKIRSGNKGNVQQLSRQLQTSDHRSRTLSALISAASPEKMDRYTKLRNTSASMNIHQQSGPLGDHQYRGDPLS